MLLFDDMTTKQCTDVPHMFKIGQIGTFQDSIKEP